jgi:hypothetical protein
LTKRGDVREYTFASQKSSQKALPWFFVKFTEFMG